MFCGGEGNFIALKKCLSHFPLFEPFFRSIIRSSRTVFCNPAKGILKDRDLIYFL